MQVYRFLLAVGNYQAPLLVRAHGLQHCLDGSVELVDRAGRPFCWLPPKSIIAYTVTPA